MSDVWNIKIVGFTLIIGMSVPDGLESVDAQKVQDSKLAAPSFIKLIRELLIIKNKG